MFVCLCRGVTSHVVDEVVAAGATTSKEIAEACGAGSDCGRCRRTLRAILSAHQVDGCPAAGTEQCPAPGSAQRNGQSSRAAR
jgi:bacterioferritin-associated ferredoxin